MSEQLTYTPEDILDEARGLQSLNLADVEPLLAESEHAFLPSAKRPDETATTLLRKFEPDPNFAVHGYVVDGRPASYIVALSGPDTMDVAIGPMYVGEAFRGLGLGKKQVEAFIDHYRTRGYCSVFTKTWAGNAASTAVFEHLGFSVVGVKENDRANGDATVAYRLEL